MKYQIFLGCTIPARQDNYEKSARRVAEALGIELVDRDFGCCGFPMEPLDDVKALSMAAVNLKKAAEMPETVVALCSACNEMMNKAEHLLKDEAKQKKVNRLLTKSLDTSYDGESPRVIHFARMLYEEYGLDKIKEKVTNPLNLTIATHPGCHYVRPRELFEEFDDPEFPHSLDELVEATGATALDYEGKTKCCGGGILAVNDRVAKAMTGGKLRSLTGKVDALVLICPFCGIMFDKLQGQIAEELEETYGVPVLYYPQLLGLALGIDPDDLGFDVNTVKVSELLEKVTQ